MAIEGSNELNMLLKARVVKILIDLDYKGSNLPKQIGEISKWLKEQDKRVKVLTDLDYKHSNLLLQVNNMSKWLKEQNKNVKIGVKLDTTVAGLNSELSEVNKKIHESKGISDIKLKVSIDVSGSAKAIKEQLRDINKIVQDFNKQYGEQIKKMQQTSESAKGGLGGGTFSNVDPSSYINSLKQAEQYMKTQFRGGLFTSTELKNANGELKGFVGNLIKANGVVHSIKYEWDKDKDSFAPISQRTVTETEKSVHKAHVALQQLQSDIEKIKDSASKTNLENVFKDLEKRASHLTLNMDNVLDLKGRIKEEQILEQNIKSENTLYQEQQRLIENINKERKNVKNKSINDDMGSIAGQLGSVNLNDYMAKNTINQLKTEFQSLKSLYKEQINEENDLRTAEEKRLDILSKIAEMQRKSTLNSSGTGFTSRGFIEDTKVMARAIKTTEDYIEVKRRLNLINKESNELALDEKIKQALRDLGDAMRSYSLATGLSLTTVEDNFAHMKDSIKNNLAGIQQEITKFNDLARDAEKKRNVSARANAIITDMDKNTVKGFVDSRDNEALKQYIAQIHNLDVALLKIHTDAKGNSKITTTFESATKNAKQLVMELSAVDGELRRVSENDVFNANRNLGLFEQLKIAMERVPVWMLAMTAFYGTINTIKNMTNQIIELDTALTELRRVASGNISIDTLFKGAVGLSKELGNNVLDVLNSISEMARTFGDFSERQLLAITKTATLMSNVSDLKPEDATKDLVGTMNAFNISAEKSIHIVDALNEVDNNYAISTQQLAEGLSKASSTGATFGVTMEELVGHITAIGAVTMESGAVIGNSLKTIYSRLTTVEGAKEALQGVGVAITDTAGKSKTAESILTDLAKRWNEISDAQKQNISVQVAGRYQLSRFLALMNNWDTATNATNTALNSQGSAMRENMKYMQSFGARINQLKSTWTELSDAVGKAFLDDGLMNVIGILKDMAEQGIKLVNTFGALPVVLAPAVLILGKMKVLSSISKSIRDTIVEIKNSTILDGMSLRISYAQDAMKGFFTGTRNVANAKGEIEKISVAWRELTLAEKTATLASKTWGVATKVALSETGIGIAIIALGYLFEKLSAKMADNKLKQEELQKMNDKMIQSYRQHTDGMQGLIKRYDELDSKQMKTKDEETEYLNLQKQLANEIPTTVSFIDANGKAHMKSAEAIKQEVDKVKELSKEQAKLQVVKFNEDIKKQVKTYDEINKQLDKLAKNRKELEKQDGKKTSVVTPTGVVYGKTDNKKNIQENVVDTLMAESQKTEAVKGFIKAIQQESLAWLEANGKMSEMSDASRSVVENFISQNEYIVRNAKDTKSAIEGLSQMGEQVGLVFSTAVENLSKTIKDNDPTKAMQIDKFQNELDSISKAIPTSFLTMVDANGKVVKSQDDVINGLENIVNIGHQVASAGAGDYKTLLFNLESVGLNASDAKVMLAKLAQQNNNTAMKAKVMSDMTGEEVQSLESLNQEALKSIDITKELFGYGNDELDGMKTRLTAMKAMEDVGGKQAKSTEKYLQLQQEVADSLGVTADELEQHKEKYYAVAEAVQQIDWTKFKPNMDFGKFLNDQLKDNFSKATIDIVRDAVEKNMFTGAKTSFETQIEDNLKKPAEKSVKEIKKIFEDAGISIDLTNVKGSMAYLEDDVNKALKKFKDFGIVLDKPTGNALIDGLIQGLDRSDGKITNTQDNMIALRVILNKAIENPQLFGSIDTSAKTTKGKVDKTKDSVGKLKEAVAKPWDISSLLGLNSGVDGAGTKVDGLKTKYDTTKTEIEKNPIKLTFGANPLENLQTMMNGGKETIQKSADGTEFKQISGDMKIVLQQAKDVKTSINKVNASLDELGVKFDTSAVRTELGKISKKTDDVRTKVKALVKTLSSVNVGSVKGVGKLTSQLAMLSINLVNATHYGSITAKQQQDIINAFSRVAVSVKSYGKALSSTNNSLGIMVSANDKSFKKIVIDINEASKKAKVKVESMTSVMHKAFKSGIKDIVSTAGSLPSQIGNAVRKNMRDATSAMDSLAKNMVKRFKSELGIHSPSRVFTELGGHVIKGLVNGLTGHDLKSLGKDVFKDFGGGIFDSWDEIKSYITGDFSKSAGGSVEGWKGVATKALMMTGQYSVPNLNKLLMQMKTESGGNSRAINLWDSNAKNGTPSKGLMQVIDPTFKAYAMRGYNSNIYDPLSNILASIRYALSRYGSLGRAYQGHGYANGGIVDKMELAWHGEEGAEAIIPLISKRRKRGVELWEQAGVKLGIDPKAIAWISKFISKKGGGNASNGAGGASASSGDGTGESGGSDTGASGVIVGNTNMDGNYEFMALADRYGDYVVSSSSSSSSSSHSSSSSSSSDNLAEAFSYNALERAVKGYESEISILNTQLGKLDTTSVKYRDGLKQLIALENSKLATERKDLEATEKRQKAIESQLKKLPAVNKQNEKQREQYNSLMQEYDSNISKIQSLKGDIESTLVDIRAKSIETFTNFIDEIVDNYDTAIKKIQQKVDNTDFKINVLQLTNPDNVKEMLNAQIEKANELQSKQSTAVDKRDELKKQYDVAVSKHGTNSDESRKAKDAYEEAVKEANDATLAVLQAEKDIKDTRAKIADDGINTLKDYYKNMEQMATDAIDKEKAELQKAHDDKMKMYDDEAKAITDLYDTKIKAMDDANAKEDYESQLADKTAKKAELTNKIALLSKDNSLEGKKKLADLKSQLADADKELTDFQKQHNRDLEKQALEDQKQQQLDAVDANKTSEQTSFDSQSQALDAQKEAVTKQYEDLINDDKKWADMRNEAIKGNFSTIQDELSKMTENINLMNKGIFDNLFNGASKLSDEVKKQVADANGLTVDNMAYNSKETTGDVTGATQANKYTMTDGKVQTSTAVDVSTPAVNTPSSTSSSSSHGSSNSNSSSNANTEYYTIKKGDNFWNLENKFGLTHGTLAKLNPSINPNKLQIGQKIVVKKGTSSSSGSSNSTSHGWKTTSALNLRSGASYNSGVIMTMPKGAKVEYLGDVNGWAKVKYNGKTGYAGKKYLQRFNTGGYTGDWIGNEGKIAMLDKKENVFDKDDTKNLLDASKILRSMKNILPAVNKANILDKLATANNIVSNISYGDINVTVQGGDKRKAGDIAKEIMKEIKKRGR